MKLYKIQNPFVLTIFGASGDLAKEKLFPALYALAEQRRFPENYFIVGFARTAKKEQEFRKEFESSIRKKLGKDMDEKILKELLQHIHYFTGQYGEYESYQNYLQYLKKLTGSGKLIHIAYFSVPPQVFKDIIGNLGKIKTESHDLRLVIEKPFGQDYRSATDLFHFISLHFNEKNVYLLDHYLGKTAVQSILHLRHNNRVLNQMLKGKEIANIQITAFEQSGISSRIGYFDQVGMIKDMIQSHLLQILALVTMSIPITETAESLHREKNNILSSLNFTKNPKNIVLGQYEGYKREKDAPKGSKTETFAAIRLFIDRESWFNSPIYLRTGKKLNEKHTYLTIEFKKFAFQGKNEPPDLLNIELYPEEKLTLKLINRRSSGESSYKSISTSDSLACEGDDCLPEHGLLLLDVIRGHKMNFLSFPEILACWKFTEDVLDTIHKNKLKPQTYKNGSGGPADQHKLTATDNFQWHDLH